MLIIYLIINTSLFLLFNHLKISTLKHLKTISQLSPIKITLILLIILSLKNLPPLTNFILKFTSLYFLITNNFIILSSIIIIKNLSKLFFYLQISFKTNLILFPQHIINLTS
ncbi:proton-conducting transporter membrane subunit, partial [Erythrobacter sanguineus]|uniref:proton-conducting transporter transmembrane domain-containing protein n=1 Tax=Erythrobacter sanguineus TaxID=198312 RepID=UPI003D15F48F